NGATIAESTFTKQTLTGDTVQLAFDYLLAGIPQEITLNAFGSMWGLDTLLYSADTTITPQSGVNSSFNIVVKWVGPALPPSGQATMSVSLGAISVTTVAAQLGQPALPTPPPGGKKVLPGAFVDLSLTDNGHAGTNLDPYSWTDFSTISNTLKGAMFIKGSRSISVSEHDYIVNDSITLAPWDAMIDPVDGVNAPWRIYFSHTGTESAFTFIVDTMEGGILSGDDLTAVEFLGGALLNCYCGNAAVFLGNCTVRGCTFANSFLCQAIDAATVSDCIFIVPNLTVDAGATTLSTFTDCVFNCSATADPMLAFTNSQWDWSAPTMPSWDAARAFFASSALSFGISAPPQPGNVPYTGYAQGLWRTPRTGIGAMDFTL
ncbi:MAG: hypothetical protein PHC61_19105, partial [Chitinivibrionales bacterium]|nr:hypothetical protein [Chitinivibrionales bacterium]